MEKACDFLLSFSVGERLEASKVNDLIYALREKLAQPEQEPVAWMVYTQEGQSVYVTDNPTDIQEGQRALPLYTEELNPSKINYKPNSRIRTHET
jgi:hypothetical protein